MDNKTKTFSKLNIFISGYGPFMNITNNPSNILVDSILKNKSEILSGINFPYEIIDSHIFKVEVDYVCDKLKECYSKLNFNTEENLNLIIHFGVYDGASSILLESKCHNYICDYIKYNGKINNEGEDVLGCKLKLEYILNKLQLNGHNVNISQDAGSYLCNFIYYKSCEQFKESENTFPVFIHIPNEKVCSREDCEKLFADFICVVGELYIK